jgi:hypothetical protein
MACKKSELRLFLSDVGDVVAEVLLGDFFLPQARSYWQSTSLKRYQHIYDKNSQLA